jgi:uncharacterized lipoprotein YmbA
MTMRRLLVLTVCASLAACGSSPKTHYHALTAMRGQGERRTVAHPVQVAAVHIPPTLDRRQIVLKRTGNSLTIASHDRWSAPLDLMTRRILAQDLAARLPKDAVVLPDAPMPADAGQIVVTLTRFGPDGHGRAALAGSWALTIGGSSKPTLRRAFELHRALRAEGGDAVAAAMSRLLATLAGQMVSDLAQRSKTRTHKRKAGNHVPA